MVIGMERQNAFFKMTDDPQCFKIFGVHLGTVNVSLLRGEQF